MAIAEGIVGRDRLYVGGAWAQPAGAGTSDAVNAAPGEVVGRGPEGSAADVDGAVSAARAAFEPWAATPVALRAELLAAAGARLAERSDEIAALIAQELGMPIGLS